MNKRFTRHATVAALPLLLALGPAVVNAAEVLATTAEVHTTATRAATFKQGLTQIQRRAPIAFKEFPTTNPEDPDGKQIPPDAMIRVPGTGPRAGHPAPLPSWNPA